MPKKRYTPEEIITHLRTVEVDHAKRLKELEQENARLKKIVANQAIDNMILKEVAKGNF